MPNFPLKSSDYQGDLDVPISVLTASVESIEKVAL